MAQQLKPEIRDDILRAAEVVFFESGYAGATMADIARTARISTGNVYRYFETKDALFDAVVESEFVSTFLALVRRRVQSLATEGELTRLGEAAQQDQEDLLGFWIEHRQRVVIL